MLILVKIYTAKQETNLVYSFYFAKLWTVIHTFHTILGNKSFSECFFQSAAKEMKTNWKYIARQNLNHTETVFG